MNTLATSRRGIGAAQPFKPTTPIGIYQERRIPMNRHTRRIILSMAAVVLAGLAMAAPRPAVAQYAFTTIDFPGAASTDLLGFTTRTMVGDFTDAEGNTHGWLLSAHHGTFRQFDVPGAWFTSLSAINHSGHFGGVYRDDPAHPRVGGHGHASLRAATDTFLQPSD